MATQIQSIRRRVLDFKSTSAIACSAALASNGVTSISQVLLYGTTSYHSGLLTAYLVVDRVHFS